MSFFLRALLLGTPPPPPADFGLGVGVNGIRDRSGVRRGSLWLLRGRSLSTLLFSFCCVGVLVDVPQVTPPPFDGMMILNSIDSAAGAATAIPSIVPSSSYLGISVVVLLPLPG